MARFTGGSILALGFGSAVAAAALLWHWQRRRRSRRSSGGAGAGGRRKVRIWMDGAFDMMHYGHMNAFRQGRLLGDELIVGVNDTKSITQCKGPPVMSDEERLRCVEGCRFVDEVVPNCPYIMNDEYLARIIKEHRIDYVVHGDDPCIVDGRDVYETAQRLGKYRTIPRTEGVSTTDIVGRLLLLSDGAADGAARRGAAHRSKFLTTGHMLRLFSEHVAPPPAGARVVYIDGSWDMFHAGHVDVLCRAKERGDYLIVGVHGDEVVRARRGPDRPVMSLQERVLSVLGCKHVDDVLIDAPPALSREQVASMRLAKVLRGRRAKAADSGPDPYEVPKALGIYEEIDAGGHAALDVSEISRRMERRRDSFQSKYERKRRQEDAYYASRYKLGEAA